MIRWSITFLVIALIAAIFGFTGIALGASVLAKIIFYICLVLFVITMIAGALAVDEIGAPAYHPTTYHYDKPSENHVLRSLYNSRVQSLSFQIQLWQGKFRVVKHENNKIRKFNQQLAKENIELETRLAETINQAAKDQQNYKDYIGNLNISYENALLRAADTVQSSS